jgi:hypothetical protein
MATPHFLPTGHPGGPPGFQLLLAGTEGPRLTRRGIWGWLGILDAATATLQQLSQGRTGVLQEMKAIGHLGSLGRSLLDAFDIGFGAVPHHYFHSRMGLEPGGQDLSSTFLEEVEGPMRLLVHQEGGVATAPP